MSSLARLSPTGWFSIVAALTLLAYARSFTSPFQFDDFNVVVNNWFLRNPLAPVSLLWARTRIVPYSTFALNFALGGKSPVGFHVVNFCIHLLATLAVFRLSFALCRTPRLRNTPLATNPLLIAVPAAFLFACHPIQVQAVTYITQRMASMAAMFYVASVLLYVRARLAQSACAWPCYVGSALCALAAFLSKENAASLPIAIVLTEWVFFGNGSKLRVLGRLAPFLALALLIPLAWASISALTSAPPPRAEPGPVHHFDQFVAILRRAADPSATSPVSYFLTQCVVLPRYLGLVFLPWGFNVDPDVPIEPGPSVGVLVGLGFMAGLLGFAVYAARRFPLLGFGLLWFFVAHSVESSFLPISDVMAEHRMYLAMPGVGLFVAALYARAIVRHQALSLAAGATVVATLAALTFSRNEVWRSPVSLWQDAVRKSPGKVRPQINLGAALHEEERLDEAIEHYCEALRLDPENQTAARNIEITLDKKLDNGDVDFELFVRADGVREVVPVHPCPVGGKRIGQKTRQVGTPSYPPASSKRTP